MANIIKIKRGFTAGAEPVGLTLGELAANLGDGKLFIGGPTGNIVQLLGGGGGVATNIPIASSSVTGVASFNIKDFVVSATGHVGLTSQIVRSVNSTNPDANGNVVISGLPSVVNIPLATSSITGVASFNSSDFSVSAIGEVSLTNVARTNSANTFTNLQTFNSGITAQSLFVSEGTTFAGSVTVKTFFADTIGGDEGGQIDFGLAASNTTLATGVSIDVYQNRLRIFETGGANRGAYIDLSAASSGVGTNLLSGVTTYTPPLATSSITGVASFGNEFVVSNLGSVSLTGNYVKSFNGITGTVSYSPRIATTSLTGVASFSSSYFTVDGSGAVSLATGYQVTGDTVVAGARTSIVRSGNTVTISDAVPVATSSVTGVASFNSSDFSVSALGDVTLLNVARTNSANTFTGLQTLNAGITTQSLFVSQGATFNSLSSFISGITSQSLFVSQGATFNSRASFTSGITSQSLFVSQGATFNSRASFTSGLTATNLFVAQGATFNGNVAINGNLTVGDAVSDIIRLPSGQVVKTYTSTTTSTSQFTLASSGALSLIEGYASADIIVQAEQGTLVSGTLGVLSTRFMIVALADGSTVTHTQYGTVSVGNTVATFTVDYSSDEWRLRATPASATSTIFRVYAVLSPIVGGAGA